MLLVRYEMTQEGLKEASDIPSPIDINKCVYIEPDESGDEHLFLLGHQQCALYSFSKEDFIFVKEKITVDPENDDIECSERNLAVFKDPHVSGYESLLYIAHNDRVIYLFSLKYQSVIWYADTGKQCSIHHVELCDREDDSCKTLYVLYTAMTVVYSIEFRDGQRPLVSRQKDIPNGFHLMRPDSYYRPSLLNEFREEREPSSIRVVETHDEMLAFIQHGCDITKSIRYRSTNSNFSYANAGQLKSGLDLLVVIDVYNDEDVELYTMSDDNQLHLSARLPSFGKVSFLHMPSGSNVLLLVVKSKVSLLYLEELENSVLRVTPALEFEVSTDQLANVMLDPTGYAFVGTMRGLLQITDVTALAESDGQEGGDSNVFSERYVIKMSVFPPPYSYLAVMMQHTGHIWDLRTNSSIHNLDPGDPDLNTPIQCFIGPMEKEGKFGIFLIIDTNILVYELDLFHDPIKSTLLHNHQVDDVFHVAAHANGFVAVNDDGKLYLYDSKNKFDLKSFQLKCSTENSGNFEENNFRAHYYICIDKYLFINGGMDEKKRLLVYNCDDGFSLVKVISTENPSAIPYDLVYLKNLDVVIGQGSDSWLSKIDCKTLEFSTVDMEDCVEIPRLLNEPNKIGHKTQASPEILFTGGDKLYKLDVREFSNWPSGKGVVCCGTLNEGTSDTAISSSGNYVVCLSYFHLKVDIYRLTSDPQLILLGSCSAHGTVDRLTISTDDQFVVVALSSGEVVTFRVMDANTPTYKERAEAILSQYPAPAAEEEVDGDPRWVSMMSLFSADKTPRGRNMLEDFVKNKAKQNTPYPAIDFESDYEPLICCDAMTDEEIQKLHKDGSALFERASIYLDMENFVKRPPKEELKCLLKAKGGKLVDNSRFRYGYEDSSGSDDDVAEVDIETEADQKLEQEEKIQQTQDGITERNDPGKVDELLTALQDNRPSQLYTDLPADRRNKMVESMVDDINKKYTTICNLL